MSSSRSRRSAVAALTLLGALVTGSAGGDAAGTATAGYSVVASLAEIPVSALQGGPVMAISGDLDQASRLAGVPRPGPDADPAEAVHWALAISGQSAEGQPGDVAVFPVGVLRLDRIGQIDEIRAELGWSVLDVATYSGIDSPPEHFGAMTGTFDAARIDAAQGAPTNGVWSLGGDDYSVDIEQVSPARPLGGALRTALQDGVLAESASTPTIEAWVEGAGTLADDASLTAVGAALDDEDVYSAIVMPTDDDPAGVRSATASTPTVGVGLAPFDAFAVGAAADDDAAQLVLAYHCGDEHSAAQSAKALRTLFALGRSDRTQQPWSEQVAIDHIDVDGPVVAVTLDLLDGRSPRLGYESILTRESFTVSP